MSCPLPVAPYDPQEMTCVNVGQMIGQYLPLIMNGLAILCLVLQMTGGQYSSFSFIYDSLHFCKTLYYISQSQLIRHSFP
jgi:hypothetical protein